MFGPLKIKKENLERASLPMDLFSYMSFDYLISDIKKTSPEIIAKEENIDGTIHIYLTSEAALIESAKKFSKLRK